MKGEPMNGDGANSYEGRRQNLAALLDRCPEVNRHDAAGEKEAWTLAHALLDLDESFRKCAHVLLPKLESSDLTPAEVYDLLHGMGEEFRHILHHIGDPRFFRYLPAWGSDNQRRE